MRTSEVWLLPLAGGQTIVAPRTGSCALIYYQGLSEPETHDFVSGFLKPGMVFFDIGAHIGEYTLLASRAVEPKGQVHAFEPGSEMFSLLTRTLAQNGVQNAVTNPCAIANANGQTSFAVREELSCSSMGDAQSPGRQRILRTDVVPVQTLDRYCAEQGVHPDLIKVDVEGAEALVLEGAEELLALPPDRAPVWIVEYSEETFARFGLTANDLSASLTAAGYFLYRLCPDSRFEPFVPTFHGNTCNLVATKRSLSNI
jgi:FkbM family methyltransferase